MRWQRYFYEVPEISEETLGHKSLHWRAVKSVWLDVAPLRMSLSYRPGPEDSLVSHQVRLRYTPDIRVGGRFRRDTRILNIHAVEDLNMRHRRLECLCEEATPTVSGYEEIET